MTRQEAIKLISGLSRDIREAFAIIVETQSLTIIEDCCAHCMRENFSELKRLFRDAGIKKIGEFA